MKYIFIIIQVDNTSTTVVSSKHIIRALMAENIVPLNHLVDVV